MTKYEIYAGDTICATYDGELEIIDEKKAPLFLEDFKNWVASRAISEQRGFTARNVKRASGLSGNADSFSTALKVNCACITDNYWVRKEDEQLTYFDVNFESYDGAHYSLALGIDSNIEITDTSSPELTNIGNSNKAWITDEEGVRWLHKRQPLKECFHEVLASKTARTLGINTVEYELVSYTEDPEEGRWGIVRSRDFTQDKGVNLEPANNILRHYNIDPSEVAENVKVFSLYGCAKDYLAIKYLDCITGNPDRHEFNYGLLKSQDSGEVVGLAPNFDNNYAFESDLAIDELAWAAGQSEWSRPYLTSNKIAKIRNEIGAEEAFRHYDIDSALQYTESRQELFFERFITLKNIDEYEGVSLRTEKNSGRRR